MSGVELTYWVPACAALVAFLATSLIPAAREIWLSRPSHISGGAPWFYAMTLGLCLLAFRWPGCLIPGAFNPDEAQFIAGALTLAKDPVFWRAVDGQTGGPLIYYPLVPFVWSGHIDYFGPRMLGLAMIGLTLWWGSYCPLRIFWGEAVARLGTLPLALFFAFSTHREFIHYSSEHPALLLLAAGLGAAASVFAPGSTARFQRWRIFLAGAALGAVPFAKPQAVPPAAVLAFGLAGWIWWSARNDNFRQRGLLTTFIGGLVVAPLGFAVMLTLTAQWKDFWISYALASFHYLGASSGFATKGITLGSFLLQSRTFVVLISGIFLALVAYGARRPWRLPKVRWLLAMPAAMTLSGIPLTLFVNRYPHYLLLLIYPLTLLAAATMASTWNTAVPDVSKKRTRQAAGFMWLGLLIVPSISLMVVQGNPFLHPRKADWSYWPEATEAIRTHTTAGDRLTVWGWLPELHVETSLPQGTRDSNSNRQTTAGPLQDYFLTRYIGELKANRPRIFVDATDPLAQIDAPRFFGRRRWSHEQFPELQEFIARSYQPLSELNGVRLYVRRD